MNIAMMQRFKELEKKIVEQEKIIEQLLVWKQSIETRKPGRPRKNE
jgi:uncharacterized coiled-coil protein SlyX